MKKIFSLLTILLLSLLLVACQDKKYNGEDIQVLFFSDRNATKVDPIKDLKPNQLIKKPEDPTRVGYMFDGWYKDTDLTEEWIFEVDTVGNNSFVLYAKWITAYYKIDYELNGGTMPSNFMYLEDYPEDQRNPETNQDLLKYLFYRVGVNNVLPRPTRTGYTFKNFYLYDEFKWEGAPEDTIHSYKPGDNGYSTVPSSLAKDLVLYAHWDPIKLSISFRANYPEDNVISNNYYRSRTLTYGFDFIFDSNYNGEQDANRLPDFLNFESNGITYEDLDYVFIGWNDKADGSGNWFGDGSGLHGNEEFTSLALEHLSYLYAQWEPKNA